MKNPKKKIAGLSIYSLLILGVSIKTLVFQIKEIVNQFKENNKNKWKPLVVLLLPYTIAFMSAVVKDAKIMQILAIIINIGTVVLQVSIVKEKEAKDQFKSAFVASYLGYILIYSIIMTPKRSEKTLTYIDNIFKQIS